MFFFSLPNVEVLGAVPMINLPSAFANLVYHSGQFSPSKAITAPEGIPSFASVSLL